MPEDVLDGDSSVIFGSDSIAIESDIDLSTTMLCAAYMIWEVATMGTAAYDNDDGMKIFQDDIEYPGRFALDERRKIYTDLHPILLKIFRRELTTPAEACKLLAAIE